MANLGSVTLNVDEANNVVWLTTSITWLPSSANPTITFQFFRDDNTLIESASDTPVSANSPITTAMIGCDDAPIVGMRTYRLVATGNSLSGNQTIMINRGTLTGAEMNT